MGSLRYVCVPGLGIRYWINIGYWVILGIEWWARHPNTSASAWAAKTVLMDRTDWGATCYSPRSELSVCERVSDVCVCVEVHPGRDPRAPGALSHAGLHAGGLPGEVRAARPRHHRRGRAEAAPGMDPGPLPGHAHTPPCPPHPRGARLSGTSHALPHHTFTRSPSRRRTNGHPGYMYIGEMLYTTPDWFRTCMQLLTCKLHLTWVWAAYWDWTTEGTAAAVGCLSWREHELCIVYVMDGVCVQLKQENVSLVVYVARVPHLYVREAADDPGHASFVLRLDSETSV